MKECIDALKERLKDDFGQDDIENVQNQLRDAIARSQDKQSDLAQELEATRDSLSTDLEQQNKLKEFRLYQRLAKKKETMKDIVANINRKSPVFETLKTKESGRAFITDKSRFSRELQIRTHEERILDDFKKKLGDNNLEEVWHSREFESDLATSIATGETAGEEIDPKVPQIGKIVNKIYDMIDREYAKRGVFIQKLEGRLAKNYHDPTKMIKTSDSLAERTKDNFLDPGDRKEKAFQRWFNFTKELVNVADSFGDHVVGDDKELERIMREDYNQITDPGELMGRGSNIPRRLSKRRTYRWKDEQAALAYIQRYGMGTLHDTIEREFREAAKNFATLDNYGIDRNLFFDSIKEAAQKIPEIANKENIGESIQRAKQIADQVDGKYDVSSSSIAMIGGNIRAALSIAKLGGIVLRSLPDVALHTLEVRRVYGGFLNAGFQTLKNLVTPLSQSEKDVLADLLKTYTNAEVGNMSRYFFADDGQTGLMSKLQRLAFKLNLMKYWDRGHRITLSTTLARHLAKNKDLSFDDIIKMDKKFGSQNVNILKAYNISGDEWDAIRKVPVKMADKKQYIVPESAREISDSSIKNILRKEGRKRINQSDIDQKRDDIEYKFMMYFKDRADYVILRPSAYTKNLLFFNTKSGTALGQIIRMLMQFKAYSAAYIEKPLGQLIRGRGAENLYQAFFKEGAKGDWAGMAGLMTYATILGYLGNQAANLAGGKGLQKPDTREAIENAISTGGALSFYGDILFGGNPKFGGGTLQQVAGPFGGEIADFIDNMIKGPVQGVSSTKRFTNAAFHFIKGNTPFINTFYTKYILDYLFLNRLQNAIHPGYTQRKINELRRNGRVFIAPPIAGE